MLHVDLVLAETVSKAIRLVLLLRGHSNPERVANAYSTQVVNTCSSAKGKQGWEIPNPSEISNGRPSLGQKTIRRADMCRTTPPCHF